MLNWRTGGGVSFAMGICAFSYMGNVFGVLVSRELCSIGGWGGGVILPWVYVYFSIGSAGLVK